MCDRTFIARDASARDLYTRAMLPHSQLLAQAERERKLRAALAGRANPLLHMLGSLLLAVGERLRGAVRGSSFHANAWSARRKSAHPETRR